jgi:integrase
MCVLTVCGERGRSYRLSVHKGTGYWCKKINGRVYYFGKVADDPDCITALEEYLRDKADLEAGREPRAKADPNALTVEGLVDRFLACKETMRDTGRLKPRSYFCLYATCKTIIEVFGKPRAVTDLQPADFTKLYKVLAKNRKSLVALGNEIIRVRSVFRFAAQEGLIPQPVVFGVLFTKPRREDVDRQLVDHRQEHGDRMFEAAEIRLLLDGLAGKEVTVKGEKVTLPPSAALRAMVLLGVNCGFGQSDCSSLPRSILDLDNGWCNFPRVKTYVPRRCPLWPETVAAIRDWLAVRPAAKDSADAKLLFLTCFGSRWVKLNASGSSDDAVGKEFAKVLVALGLKRSRRSFYSLRHTFATIAGNSTDNHAVCVIMGHKIPGMIGNYVERFEAGRLRHVADMVRAWLFSPAPVVCEGGKT